MLIKTNKIRNFSIIAHIDHGKSTLADRLLELTNLKNSNKSLDRVLDSLSLEQEKGITIKLNAVQLYYPPESPEPYIFNLIDTPGHVDFMYEVSRSLAACEGVILLVDAVKGIQAQTLAYYEIAKKLNLKILPVLGQKKTRKEEFGIGSYHHELEVEPFSLGIEGLPEISRISFCFGYAQSLENSPNSLMKTKLYNSKLLAESAGKTFTMKVKEWNVFDNNESLLFNETSDFDLDSFQEKSTNNPDQPVNNPPPNPPENDNSTTPSGNKGLIIGTVKVGDTALNLNNNSSPLEGYQEVKPNVYSNLYPGDSSQYKEFKKSLEELQIQDSSLSLETIDSQLLGPGFRCGFLGILHREIICERLEKEFNCEIITTPPSINYQVIFANGEIIETNNPQKIPTKDKVKNIEELFISLNITTSEEHLGAISQLCQNKRVHRSFAYDRAKVVCEGLKTTLNQQTFTVPIQAAIGNQVIARETLPALKKHVTGNMYGGDRTRKMKL
ncbi:6899_t:CDS:2 [Entrophospora sp. SA101]|nr:6899_t:CDS:2 [Entrophospora sp. SA101]